MALTQETQTAHAAHEAMRDTGDTASRELQDRYEATRDRFQSLVESQRRT
ncbi:hypothetical protein [Roseospira marina]|nr:hypothetical protein [Roseospira marina]MBB4314452.1 hypothetical protein [Roseospira marina]MBB5087612.1 hypothetical protein [Roseospira marina]